VLIRDYYPKPVVCAVDGPAIGLGCELVLASDIVVASPRATFGLPEVRYGLAPSGGGAGRLVKRLASSRAMWMLLSGESMDAQLAERFGLVTALTAEDDDPAEVALRMAGVIADQSPEAVRATKLLAVRSTGWFDEEIRRLSDTVIDRMSRSADAVSRVGGFSAARRDA
jgi:enoyl-CoA hydratase/carnithine racemase